MVLLGRIELPTSALPRMRSTTELQQRDHFARTGKALVAPGRRGALLSVTPGFVKQALPRALHDGRAYAMAERPAKPTREERLAAQLRENLRRRKAQARALGQRPATGDDPGNDTDDGGAPQPPGRAG
jgi:hypothetical protein